MADAAAKAHGMIADQANPQDVANLFDRAREMGGLDAVIVNAGVSAEVGSVSANNRSKDSSVYTASKSGIQSFADAFRKEMGEKNIRVGLIEPGAVGSDMQESTPEAQRQKIAEAKMLKAEDVAELAAFILTRPERCTISAVRIEERVQSR